MSQIATYKGMLLNMSSGSKLTENQLKYIIDWVKSNFSSSKTVYDLAYIAWQYDLIELRDRLLKLSKQLESDLLTDDDL